MRFWHVLMYSKVTMVSLARSQETTKICLNKILIWQKNTLKFSYYAHIHLWGLYGICRRKSEKYFTIIKIYQCCRVAYIWKHKRFFFFVKPTSPNWWKLATSLPSIDLCKVNVISIDHYVSWFPFIAQIRTSWHISGSFLDSSQKFRTQSHDDDDNDDATTLCVWYILWWYFDNYSLTLICAAKQISQQVLCLMTI